LLPGSLKWHLSRLIDSDLALHPNMEKTDREFGAEVLRFHADRFIRELLTLLSEVTDEAVHQTRVESRRTRAALEAFQQMFPPHPFKSAYGAVRQITCVLGEPRETAVSLRLLRELAKNGAAGRSCLKYLGKHLNYRLKRQEEQMQKKLRRIDPLRLHSKLEFLLSIMDSNEAPRGTQPQGASATDAARLHASRPFQPTLFQMRESAVAQGYQILAGCMKPILEYRTNQRFDSASDEDLHSLRITAKRARYAMEIYSSVWPGGLSRCIEKACKFQEVAGLHNDWSVLRRYMHKEVKHLSKGSLRRAFEIGRLTEYIELRRTDLRKTIRTALLELQEGITGLLDVRRLPIGSAPLTKPVIARSANIRAAAARKRG
jgi:CHAD domain-containing protein